METQRESFHHANLLVGTEDEAQSYLRSSCDRLGIELLHNPDFFSFKVEVFGIDEARKLGSLAARKSLTKHKIFLIAPTRFTFEAQNALLKTFEEPFPGTIFFLAVREEELILPTLRSRMRTVRLNRQGESEPSLNEAEKFLSFSIKDRLLFAQEFVSEKRSLPIFLDDLLIVLRERKPARPQPDRVILAGNGHSGREGGEALKKVYVMKHFAHDIAASPRLIIEHLSLVL